MADGESDEVSRLQESLQTQAQARPMPEPLQDRQLLSPRW